MAKFIIMSLQFEQFTRKRERESVASEGQPQPEEPQNRSYIPTYKYLYILDSEQALLNFRMAIPSNGQCRRQLFNELEHLSQDHNSFAQTYTNLKTLEEEEYESRWKVVPQYL